MKLTDTQAILLSAAANRDDRLVPLTERLKGGAALTVGQRLIELRLAEEVSATRSDPCWRQDDAGNPVALRITRAGMEAIGIVEDDAIEEVEGTPVPSPTEVNAGAAADVTAPVGIAGYARRPGRRDLLINLLSRDNGASIAELMAATGWLPHTTRAALTGVRKRGVNVERFAGADGTRYRIGAVESSDRGGGADTCATAVALAG